MFELFLNSLELALRNPHLASLGFRWRNSHLASLGGDQPARHVQWPVSVPLHLASLGFLTHTSLRSAYPATCSELASLGA